MLKKERKETERLKVNLCIHTNVEAAAVFFPFDMEKEHQVKLRSCLVMEIYSVFIRIIIKKKQRVCVQVMYFYKLTKRRNKISFFFYVF